MGDEMHTSRRRRPAEVVLSGNQLGRLGERCKLPSGVWGEAPADIDFGVFCQGKTHLTAIVDFYFTEISTLASLTKFILIILLWYCHL